MKRRMVLYLHGGQTHIFHLAADTDEREYGQRFLDEMNSIRDGQPTRAVTWGGLTFVTAWMVGFCFDDEPEETEHQRWHREINERLISVQEKAVEAMLLESRRGDEWKE